MSGVEQFAKLRISLADIAPKIWRRVEVSIDMNLKGLHDVIQAVMDWRDYHLFEFHVGDKIYGRPEPDDDYGREVLQARLAKLHSLLRNGIKRFEYVYDFGDDWEHLIVIEAVADADPALKYPRFLDGARRAPPEDVGGVPGYYDFIEAVTNPRHREHRQMVEWYGGPYDPDDIGLFELRLRLGQIAKRRHAGKAAYAKKAARGS